MSKPLPPYFIAGESAGAWLAYELVAKLDTGESLGANEQRTLGASLRCLCDTSKTPDQRLQEFARTFGLRKRIDGASTRGKKAATGRSAHHQFGVVLAIERLRRQNPRMSLAAAKARIDPKLSSNTLKDWRATHSAGAKAVLDSMEIDAAINAKVSKYDTQLRDEYDSAVKALRKRKV